MTLAERWRQEALRTAILNKMPEGWQVAVLPQKTGARWLAETFGPGCLTYSFDYNTTIVVARLQVEFLATPRSGPKGATSTGE